MTSAPGSPPQGFTKDLVARFICWHIQEQAFGGLDPQTAKLLDGFAQGDKMPDRRLKVGTVLVREYQGERHTVTVVSGGYVWREGTYASISTIARPITGTAWNGPRFLGLRIRRDEIRGARACGQSGPLASPCGLIRKGATPLRHLGDPTTLAARLNDELDANGSFASFVGLVGAFARKREDSKLGPPIS